MSAWDAVVYVRDRFNVGTHRHSYRSDITPLNKCHSFSIIIVRDLSQEFVVQFSGEFVSCSWA